MALTDTITTMLPTGRTSQLVALMVPEEKSLSVQGAFFQEGLENSSNLEELDKIAEDIRRIRASLSAEELKTLRAAYRERRRALTDR